MSNQIAKYDEACRLLAEAVAVDEVREILNQAEAWRHYARQAKNRDLEIGAAQIRFRAERRLGEFLIKANETGQISVGRPKKNCAEPEQFTRVTLEQAGIDRKLSSRAQRMAVIEPQKFEQLLERHRLEVLEQNNKVSVDLLRTSAEADGREKRRQLAQALSDATAVLPTGRKFPCVYADPPWHRNQGVTDLSYENHYPTMTWDQICAMPVADLLLPDAWVFMWIPRAHLLALHPVEMEFADDDGRVISRKVKLPLAWAVARAWGCENYSTCFVWTKTDEQTPDDAGMGLLVRDQDEILLMFKRGRGLPKPATDEKFTSNHRERKREHSRKPDHYREMIRSMTGGVPVLELFARVDAEHPLPPDWQAWGNEAAPIMVAEIAEREQLDAVAESPALQDVARHLEPGIVEQPDTASVDAANAVPPAQRPGSNSQDDREALQAILAGQPVDGELVLRLALDGCVHATTTALIVTDKGKELIAALANEPAPAASGINSQDDIDRDEYRALSFIKEGGQAEGAIVEELRAQGFLVGHALQKLTLLGKQRLGMLAEQFAVIEILREADAELEPHRALERALTAVSAGEGDGVVGADMRELIELGYAVLQGETLLVTDAGRAWLAPPPAVGLRCAAQFQQHLTDDEFVEWQALASVAAHLVVDAELVRGLIGCGYLAVILDDQLALTEQGHTWLRSIEQFVERLERVNGGSIGVDLDPPPAQQIDLEDLLKPAVDLPLFLAVQS